MISLNKVMLIGNLGKDPEDVTGKASFVRISIATTRKYRNDRGDLIENTQWPTVYFNGKLAKVALDYLKKGSRVYVSGELRTNEWTDKDNKKNFSTAVYASELLCLDAKQSEAEASMAESEETMPAE